MQQIYLLYYSLLFLITTVHADTTEAQSIEHFSSNLSAPTCYTTELEESTEVETIPYCKETTEAESIPYYEEKIEEIISNEGTFETLNQVVYTTTVSDNVAEVMTSTAPPPRTQISTDTKPDIESSDGTAPSHRSNVFTISFWLISMLIFL